jgi:uncharacterized protein
MNASGYSILRIYASSTDRIGSRLFYEHMVHLAKEKGISGVTVYRGIMGYGSSSRHISSSRFWELTEKLPVVIEMIDKTEALEVFYKLIEPELLKMKKGCLATLEPVAVKLLQSGRSNQ